MTKQTKQPEREKTTKQREKKIVIDKINPTPKTKCPKCGGKIMVMMGVVVCSDCDLRQDLYD